MWATRQQLFAVNGMCHFYASRATRLCCRFFAHNVSGRSDPGHCRSGVCGGAEGDRAELGHYPAPGPNATLAPTQGDHRHQTLREIIDRHPQFREAKLLKFDRQWDTIFEFIEGSLPLLASAKPVIFFEYDPTFHAPNFRAENLNSALLPWLLRMIVYANQGHFMLSLNEAGRSDRFGMLTRIFEVEIADTGAHDYLDIGLSAHDADLQRRLSSQIKALLDPDRRWRDALDARRTCYLTLLAI